METKFEWDGEKVKSVIPEEVDKHSPKEILESILDTRKKIAEANAEQTKVEGMLEMIKTNLTSFKEHLGKLEVFENKVVEIQKEKLKLHISQVSEEYKKKAFESAKATIAKDPDAYTEGHMKNMPYLDYQRLLATDKKIAEKVHATLITKYLFEEPIFDNPFKEE